MKKREKKSLASVIVIIASLVLLLPGCQRSAARMPIEANLSFSESPVLGKPVQVTATLNLVKDYFKEVVREVDVKITLSEGFQLLDGNLEWKGDIQRNQTYTLRATVRTIKTGTWQIGVNAWGEADGVNGFTGLYVTVSEKRAIVSDRPPSNSISTPVPTYAPSP